MAKPPSKRRGITLGHLNDGGAALDAFKPQPAASVPLGSDRPCGPAGLRGGDSEIAAAPLAEQILQLTHMNAELGRQWQRQAEALQTQMQELERQREQIARQARQLQTLEQGRHASRRVGVLLTLLILSGSALVASHTWPRLQEVVVELDRLGMAVTQIAPQLQGVRGDVASIASRMGQIGQMGSAVAALRDEVSAVHSDLGAVRQAMDARPDHRSAVQADAGGARSLSQAVPHTATTVNNPYWASRQRMPW